MRISRSLLQTLIFTLLCTVSAEAALSGERMEPGLRPPTAATHKAASAKELSRTQSGGRVRFEKFILQSIADRAPAQVVANDAKADERLDASVRSENASPASESRLSPVAPPLVTASARRLSLIEKAYLDAYVILGEDNSCSRFFGGTRAATGVLNSLYPRLTTAVIDNHIGISMAGAVSLHTNTQTGVSYRLFQKALINLHGPFYQSANLQSQGFFKKIGHYSANTREARVTMLLHELGHLLTGVNGDWLLPNDGNDRLQVAANTDLIMEKCAEQIDFLSQAKDAKEGQP